MPTKTKTFSLSDIFPLVFVGFALVFAVHHIFTWDIYGLEILKLRGRAIISQLSPQDMNRMIFICQTRHQSDCLEKYQSIKARTSLNPQPFWELAEYFKNKKQIDKSLFYLGEYFKNKGQSTAAAFDYATLLERRGENNLALTYYDFAVRHSEKIAPLYTRGYVQLLIKSNKLVEARTWIKRVQSLSKESVYFMQGELRSIEERISAQSQMPAAKTI